VAATPKALQRMTAEDYPTYMC